jgi:plastocyanin
MKQLLIILLGFTVGMALTAGVAMTATQHVARAPAKAPAKAAVTIRHQTRGCHSWSINAGTSRTSLTTTLARGGTIRFVDNDVMPHKLVKTSGPAVRYLGNPSMRHMSASVSVTFARAGTYRFTTKAGEDYPGVHVKTIGEDNVVHLVVKVA